MNLLSTLRERIERSSSKSDFVDSRNDTPEGISGERISDEDIVLIEKLRAVWMDMSIPKIRLHLDRLRRRTTPRAHARGKGENVDANKPWNVTSRAC